MNNTDILIIDETIREGMQFQGVMFSPEQRCQIVDFQEKLGVNICQAGYPPAHDSEVRAVEAVLAHSTVAGHTIDIAAMGRAGIKDADLLLKTGIRDLHFHIHIKKNARTKNQLKESLEKLSQLIVYVKEHNNRARISIAMLDIGRFRHDFLQQCIRYLQDKNLDIISLPDTSGILTPNQVFDKIDRLSSGNTRIAIHCHNDMGMATANGIMGILAGGRVLEASALGIGERNGITDLYTAGKTLKELGFKIRLNTDDIETFRAYYHYVDNIVRDQTGIRLFTPCTPGLENAISTHVADTHADGDFGRSRDEAFCINVLCGNTLVKKFLDLHGIGCPGEKISELVSAIKDQSSRLNRSLAPEDIKTLILSFPD